MHCLGKCVMMCLLTWMTAFARSSGVRLWSIQRHDFCIYERTTIWYARQLQNPELAVYGPYMDRYRAGFFDEMPRLPAPTPTAQLRVLIPFDTLPSQIGFVVSSSDLDSPLSPLFDQRHAFGFVPVSVGKV